MQTQMEKSQQYSTSKMKNQTNFPSITIKVIANLKKISRHNSRLETKMIINLLKNFK